MTAVEAGFGVANGHKSTRMIMGFSYLLFLKNVNKKVFLYYLVAGILVLVGININFYIQILL